MLSEFYRLELTVFELYAGVNDVYMLQYGEWFFLHCANYMNCHGWIPEEKINQIYSVTIW